MVRQDLARAMESLTPEGVSYRNGAPGLVGGGFQDGGVALVGGDDAVKLFEVVGF
jgi:hypothetical protein